MPSSFFVSAGISFISFIICFGAAQSLTIVEEQVSPVVRRNGSHQPVVFDCEYAYEHYEVSGLTVKWFWDKDHEPVYQWIPGGEPLVRGILKDRVNVSYQASNNKYTEHRALQILRPTSELSGTYTCTVSTYYDEKKHSVRLLVYAPVTSMDLTYHKLTPTTVNVTCAALGLYPRPRMTLYVRTQHHKFEIKGINVNAIKHRVPNAFTSNDQEEPIVWESWGEKIKKPRRADEEGDKYDTLGYDTNWKSGRKKRSGAEEREEAAQEYTLDWMKDYEKGSGKLESRKYRIHRRRKIGDQSEISHLQGDVSGIQDLLNATTNFVKHHHKGKKKDRARRHKDDIMRNFGSGVAGTGGSAYTKLQQSQYGSGSGGRGIGVDDGVAVLAKNKSPKKYSEEYVGDSGRGGGGEPEDALKSPHEELEEVGGWFSIYAHAVLADDTLHEDGQLLECEAMIPGTPYAERRNVVYFPGFDAMELYAQQSTSSASSLRATSHHSGALLLALTAPLIVDRNRCPTLLAGVVTAAVHLIITAASSVTAAADTTS